jgi:transposase
VTIGIDLGDRFSRVAAVSDLTKEVVLEDRVATTPVALRAFFGGLSPSRIAMEACTVSAWVSRLLKDLGHDVLVCDPRRLQAISQSDNKNDRLDARMLARLAAANVGLLHPVFHRSQTAQRHLEVLRARDLVQASRTARVNHVRCVLKGEGIFPPTCGVEAFVKKVTPLIPPELEAALTPLLGGIAADTATIRLYDAQVEALCTSAYPETERMRQVHGVGALTALGFLLTIEDPKRFRRSRTVGAYFGLRPRRDQSGESDPQRRITKAGDGYVRRLLVGCAHYLIGPLNQTDSALRRYGLAIAARGGKNGKKRAVIAVARKLAVLLHHLWVSGETYEPLRNAREAEPARAK